eukprot:12935068-Prorocentrum_lima.AAC.1
MPSPRTAREYADPLKNSCGRYYWRLIHDLSYMSVKKRLQQGLGRLKVPYQKPKVRKHHQL